MSAVRRMPKGNAAASALEDALAELGMECNVVAMGQLVVIVQKSGADPAALSDASRRGELAALAETHGFTHVALQLPGGGR